MKQRVLFGSLLFGATMGLGASFLQMVEKVRLLQGANQAACDISSVFSCSSVLSAWQSSVFGFPNALMCMIFFTLFASMGVVGVSGVQLPRALRLAVHALALFVLGFGMWFLWQSIFVIQALCILCLICFAGLLVVNWAWLRINAADLPVGAAGRAYIAWLIKTNTDTLLWVLVAIALALVILGRFF